MKNPVKQDHTMLTQRKFAEFKRQYGLAYSLQPRDIGRVQYLWRYFPILFVAVLLFIMPAHSVHAASFNQFVSSLWPEAKRRGISKGTFNAAFNGLTMDKSVLKFINRQPEFVKPIWGYLDGAVNDYRIKRGKEMAAKYATVLNGLEARYGVDRYTVLAIWGLETTYGDIFKNKKIIRNTIRSLATLAYAGGRYKKSSRTQLFAALKIIQMGEAHPKKMMGSWAGAMGHTQFMPTSYLEYAADANGDGKRNIWTYVPDALASTANYLARHGWQTGQTWGYEVTLPNNFNFSLASPKNKKSLAYWQKQGIQRVAGRQFQETDREGYIYLPAGARGPAFLMLKNFKVIKRYNNANSYALAIGHLADRLRGGAPFISNWPRHEKSLSFKQRKELQRLLTAKGFSTGGVDGRLGANSRAAIRAYQRHRGWPADGFATLSLLKSLQ